MYAYQTLALCDFQNQCFSCQLNVSFLVFYQGRYRCQEHTYLTIVCYSCIHFTPIHIISDYDLIECDFLCRFQFYFNFLFFFLSIFSYCSFIRSMSPNLCKQIRCGECARKKRITIRLHLCRFEIRRISACQLFTED